MPKFFAGLFLNVSIISLLICVCVCSEFGYFYLAQSIGDMGDMGDISSKWRHGC